tara:strand:- start:11 stop:1372 length:1362 start_codon:yes stop_codon:yes gene_type:complete
MASAYLTRTPASAGNRKTWTFSAWFKIGDVSTGAKRLLTSYDGSTDTNQSTISYGGATDYVMQIYNAPSGSPGINLITNRLFRDCNAWYHIVVSVDTTQTTGSDRAKLYINGVQETSFATESYGSQNEDFWINSNQLHTIGRRQNNSQYFDGSMAHIHFIDGTAYTPTTFGETDTTTGIWKPKTNPSVTYGNNGFFLKFENSANMGLDSSGNSNNFTTSGTIIQTKDTPTNNTATWDALNTAYTGATFANANNTLNTGTSNYTFNISNIGLDSGKWYWETKLVSTTASGGTTGLIGIASVLNTGSTDWLGQQSTNYGYYQTDGKIRNNSAWSNYGNSYAVGDIIGCALDLENNKLYFSKNGTWQDSGDPTSGSTGTGAISITDPASTFLGCYFAAAGDYDSGKSYQFAINFGDGKFGTTAITSAGSNGNGSLFEYDVPSGYYAVNIKNMAGNS